MKVKFRNRKFWLLNSQIKFLFDEKRLNEIREGTIQYTNDEGKEKISKVIDYYEEEDEIDTDEKELTRL
ncbi:unnamed protein product [Rhizophagus irregularis]|nr:unnamed protein product [Rhizophagus irregularis]